MSYRMRHTGTHVFTLLMLISLLAGELGAQPKAQPKEIPPDTRSPSHDQWENAVLRAGCAFFFR